jgi:asparagine synthase (glutamine-hydrolysing)
MEQIIINKTHTKFKNDSIQYQDEFYLLETQGVFLNYSYSKNNDLSVFLISEYKKKGEGFVKDLRGSFLVYLFDKQRNIKLIYTNHVGDQKIFYTVLNHEIIVSNSIKTIICGGKQKGMTFTLNNNAAYYMLTFGFMLHNHTLVNEIKRLPAGNYLRIEDNMLSVINYYTINNTPNFKITEEEAIENIDLLFRQAVKREFDKDLEYNFKHITTLSGGLDSRMTTWVAHEMGYKNMTALTFSQSNYLDETVANKIANDLKLDWIFKSLDHGNFLTNVEEVIAISEGIGTYSGQTHGKSSFDVINFKDFGLLHTGMIGDVIISSFISGNYHKKPSLAKMTSDKLINKVLDVDLSTYENQELFLLYSRGFNGALTGLGPIQQYTEVTSPFLDIDFMNYCFSLPLSMRKNHNIYKKWIIKKYPKAANYIWERIGARINEPYININKKIVPISTLHKFIITGLQLRLGILDKTECISPNHMNPFDLWFKTNEALPKFFNAYYNENIDRINDQELRKNCAILFKGTTTEKMQVLSLLAALKLLWE